MASIVTTAGSTATFAEVVDLGGDYAYARQSTDLAGAGSDVYGAFPIRESVDFSPTIGETKKTSEGGTETITSTTEAWLLKYVTQQVSKAILYALPKAIAGKNMLFVLELNNVNNLVNGKWLYAAVLGKMTKKPGIKNKVSPEFEFQMLKPTTSIAITLASATFPNFGQGSTGAWATAFDAATLTIVAGEFYGLVEITN